MLLLLKDVVGGLVRLALVPLFGWLVSLGVIAQAPDAEIYAEATAYVLGAIWVVWNSVKRLRLLNTAAGSKVVQTVQEVHDRVNAGEFASALTPKDVTPIIVDNNAKTNGGDR